MTIGSTAVRVASGFAVALFAASSAFAAPAAGGNDQKDLMKTCNAQATQKGLKGDDRKSFMKDCLSGKTAAAATTAAPAATTANNAAGDQKTLMKTCNADATAKGLKGDDRKAFMKTCLSGDKTTASAPATVTPAAATTGAAAGAGKGWHSTATGNQLTPAATTNTPAPTTGGTKTPTPPAPQGNGQATLAKLGTNQFQTAALAQGHCSNGIVVWVNTESKIYHYKGYSDYGKTKSSAFMCEADAKTAGDRAAKDEKAPH